MSAPAVAVSRDGKKFAAAWMDKRAGNKKPRVYWAASEQPEFSADEPINPIAAGKQDHPSIAFDRAGVLWVAWEQRQSGSQEIWIRSNAKTMLPTRLSTKADGTAYQPVMACNDGVVAVVYEAVVSGQHKVICRVIAR